MVNYNPPLRGLPGQVSKQKGELGLFSAPQDRCFSSVHVNRLVISPQLSGKDPAEFCVNVKTQMTSPGLFAIPLTRG